MPTNLGTFSDDNNLQCGKRRAAHRVGLSEIRVIKRTTAQSHRAPAPRAAPHRSTRAVSRSACRRGVGRPGRDGPQRLRRPLSAAARRRRRSNVLEEVEVFDTLAWRTWLAPQMPVG